SLLDDLVSFITFYFFVFLRLRIQPYITLSSCAEASDVFNRQLNEQINLDGSLIIGEVYSQFFSPAVKEIE
ncbi:hypothetical protein QT227_13160, partial [Escherichia coli]|uniref:hypothetical protein n=1 Tax=Escherichia coli TaxID=562 RepID=UPI00259CEDCE